jgi:hypothetical protein
VFNFECVFLQPTIFSLTITNKCGFAAQAKLLVCGTAEKRACFAG